MPRLLRTLRFRLAAAFMLWAGLFQLALALALPTVRARAVLRELDDEMGDHASAMATRIAAESSSDAGLQGLMPEFIRGLPYFVEIRSADGRVLAASPNIGDRVLPFDPASAVTPEQAEGGRQGFWTVPLGGAARPAAGGEAPIGRARLATVRAERPGVNPVYVQVAMPLDVLDRLSGLIERLMIVAILVGMVGAGVAGWIVAGAMLARVDRVASAVRGVTPNGLDERIDLPTSDDEIGRLAADVNRMLARLAVAFRSQERFISDVSHELKTPVAVLLTEAQVLKYSPHDDTRYDRFVISVEDEMRRLGKLVESFLMLARFGHGRRFLAEGLVDLNDIALDCVQHASLLASQHGVGLNLQLYDAGEALPEARVRGDAELLQVVLDNLIRNAVQVSKRGDSVEALVDCNDSEVTLTVQDHGPGVPPEFLERVFERFTQAPGAKFGRRGTGLGLTIAKGVVELHGGRISVHNRAEGGCVFTVRLPRATGPLGPVGIRGVGGAGGVNGAAGSDHAAQVSTAP